VLDLFDEAGGQEPSKLFANCFSLLLIKATKALLHRLGVGLDVEVVLDDSMGNAGHVRGLPRKDVGITAQELYKSHFHVWRHGGAYKESIVGILGIDLDHLGVVGQVEGHCRVLLHVVGRPFSQLTPNSGKIGGSAVGRSEGCTLLLIEISIGHGGHHHDDSPWTRHFEL